MQHAACPGVRIPVPRRLALVFALQLILSPPSLPRSLSLSLSLSLCSPRRQVDQTGECRAPPCTLAAVSWEDLVSMEKTGKAFLGGLGGMASERSGVWACVRGWDDTEQRRCGEFRVCAA